MESIHNPHTTAYPGTHYYTTNDSLDIVFDCFSGSSSSASKSKLRKKPKEMIIVALSSVAAGPFCRGVPRTGNTYRNLKQQQIIILNRFATNGRSGRIRENKSRASLPERRRQKKTNEKSSNQNNGEKPTGTNPSSGGNNANKKKMTTGTSQHIPWRDDPVKLKEYQKTRYTAMAQRAAPLVVFGLLINLTEQGNDLFHRYLCPLQIEQLYGPSMVPSIHPYGDTWLHTTPMWDSIRSIYYTIRNMVATTPRHRYPNGDIIIWRDPNTNRRACKRIVGVAGDTVQRYGQFVEYYAHREDVGIPWDERLGARGLDPSCPWDCSADGGEALTGKDGDSIYRSLVVPEGHVWLEGDNPLLSVDSRHYGPVPVAYLEGHLVWRLWPLLRHVNIRKHDQMLLRHRNVRPQPLDLETPKQRGQEDRLAFYYNLHRRPRVNSVASEEDKPSSDSQGFFSEA